MDEELKRTILSYLRDHYTLSLATLDGQGKPWAASVFYANDGFVIYFLTDPETRHGRNILQNPTIAATINEDYHEWRKIKGIQLEGRAEIVTSRLEKAKALATYLHKFPFLPQFVPSDKFSLAKLTKATSTRFFKILPSRILFLDNEKGFSHRDELVVV